MHIRAVPPKLEAQKAGKAAYAAFARRPEAPYKRQRGRVERARLLVRLGGGSKSREAVRLVAAHVSPRS